MMQLVATRPSRLPPQKSSQESVRLADAIKQVAIVEDELIVAWTIEAMLDDFGFDVIGIFANGEDAVDALRNQAVDLVCLDINLGAGIDGIEAARQITDVQRANVLFISAYSDSTTKTRIRELVPGAALIGKPVTQEALRQAIQDLRTVQ